ncbi:GNAT family N-acetyltransferase [Vibrio sp. SCSIO 43136]|nr:GNAT family N-acetyltransferase [Vibrio sp. SCSIO 43136]
MKIRVGTLQECVQVVNAIPEFVTKETVTSLASRIERFDDALVLVAELEGELIGFKIGYALDNNTYYSWFGGVAPIGRKQGTAQALLDYQEQWVMKRGYKTLKVKSRNQFGNMLRFLIKNSYMIDDFEPKVPEIESRIWFKKHLHKN